MHQHFANPVTVNITMLTLTWKIVPEKNFRLGDSKRIAYTYLHGDLQKDAGTDIFGILNCDLNMEDDGGYVDSSTLQNGIYFCKYRTLPCLLYYWNGKGLCVYADDKESNNYALYCYENRISTI